LGTFLYTIFTTCYSRGIGIAALWNTKARRWVDGRKGLLDKVKQEGLQNDGAKRIWMHCASLGEFEQGRPLLELLRARYPGVKIILSFFSPSGYEVMKEYKGADHIYYLPMDSPSNAATFIDAIDPSLVLWVKYEFWYYYLAELKKRNICTLLVSGIFRENQPFFKWYGGIWRKMTGCFTHFFVQNEFSEELLRSLVTTENITVTGDTRFDRVITIARNFEAVPHIDKFCGAQQVVVAGSTWEEDEIELMHFVQSHPEIKFIIAPHEIDEENLTDVKKEFPGSVFYSELEKANGNFNEEAHVLIIDNIGMLSRLYRYATIAYVGGGFGADGVHNVLEAAVYGKPVVFGPVFEKFDEAIGLKESGGAVSASGPLELEAILSNLFSDEAQRNIMGMAAGKYVQENTGASSKIIDFIQEKRLLTN
jgi:3-deoxy-D-manno-octulosonic-acid transferase